MPSARDRDDAARPVDDRVQLALDAAEMGSFVWHPADDRGEPDARMLALFGLPADSTLTLRDALATLIHPGDRDRYAAAVARAMTPGGTGELREEIRVVHPGGAARWVAVTARVAFQGEPPRPARMVGVAADVTARKQAEAAVRESEARYRALATASADVVYRMSPDWSEMRQLDGRGFLSDTREPNASWLGRYIHPDDHALVTATIEAAVRTRTTFTLEHRVIRADGTLGWTHSRAVPVIGADGEIAEWIGAASDVTLRREAEEALRATAARTAAVAERTQLGRQLALAEEEERRRLARELHDQLGQHLAGLTLGLAASRRLVPADAPAQPLLEQLHALTLTLTRDIRSLALALRPPELDDLGFESALDTYVREWAARHGVEADVAVLGLGERALPAEVNTALYRIAQEALTNVARHAAATHVSVVVDKPDGEVRLIVEDDGRGFDVDEASERTRRERRLGLAGMRERAALVGGAVTVESSVGGGTSVYVRIPLAPRGAPDDPDATASR